MLTVDKCDILWSVVKNQQTVTMKVCIEPQLPIMTSNMSDLNISSLQNYSYTLPNTTSLNIPANISNISMPFNISNTSNTYTTIDDTMVAPSPADTMVAPSPADTMVAPSPADTIVSPSPAATDNLVVMSTDITSVAPSSRMIRGSTTPSPLANLTILSPSPFDNTGWNIFAISFCSILIVVLVWWCRRIRYGKLKIPFNKGKLKNTKDRKYIKGKIYTSTVTPNHLIEKPKDLVIEHLNNEEKTKRQVPHPPSKEVSEADETNDTPPSE
jgi:hypothetical protein